MPNTPTFALRHVALVTRSLAQLLPFYRDTLGFIAQQPDPATLTLRFSAQSAPAITFTENPAAAEPTELVAGLFHVAILVPDRPALAAVLAQLVEKHQPIEGLSDHGVSEAVYLTDPDGNGLEIYYDRPRREWPVSGDRIAMVTRPVDHRALLLERPTPPPAAPLATARLGHIHLRVSALEAARNFYTTEVGLAVRQDNYEEAVFMAADGYHHHVAANTWGHPRQRPAGATIGLTGFTAGTIRVKQTTELDDPDHTRVTLEPM
ncbi:MAG: Glyoxalase/bleomycin resistance protein/dioxygenase [Verrucomicrobia bacterium]|nr:Glyoxalase/bleomycin resistance protein/dioxygenase [Verrucomicrobiota bacterium]